MLVDQAIPGHDGSQLVRIVGSLSALLLVTLSEILQAKRRANFGYEIQKDLEPCPLPKAPAIVTGGQAILQIAVCRVVMLQLNWQGTLVLLLSLPLIVSSEKRALERTQAADYQEKLSDAGVASQVHDQMTALPLVRAFAARKLHALGGQLAPTAGKPARQGLWGAASPSSAGAAAAPVACRASGTS